MLQEEYKELELSTQILIKEAKNRGIEVEVLDKEDNFIQLRKGERVEYVKQATKTSADTYIAPLIMENKEVTKKVLQENDINVPKGITVKSVEEAIDKFTQFKDKEIVIKPKSTNFGKGVIILKGTYSKDDYKNAVEHAFDYDKFVLIEEFIPGREFRFLVIGDETVAILHRVPANVTGDGIHTIEQLVHKKNMDPLRGKGYVTPLEKISLETTEQEYLEAQNKNLQYIPQKGETIYLRENSNISTGGDSVDYTDEVLQDYKAVAVKAAKAVGAKICGADIIIQDILAAPNATNYSVIELNFNPAIHIHDYPYQGKNRHVENKILELLHF
jgi:glutamate--cysteine ligase